MQASSSAPDPTRVAGDWANSLKNVASQARQMGVGISKIYYDKNTRELVLFKATNAANRYEEFTLDSLKSHTLKILSTTDDKEVKYRAVKALFKLMSAKPIDSSTLQELTQVSLHAAQGLSPSKAQTIRTLLESAKRSIPSEQGGTGVHFLEVDPPKSEDPNVRVRYGIYKFVPNPRQVLFANSVLKRLGFIVPKTKMVLRDSPEGKRAIELFQASCPERTIPQKGQILVMDRMRADPLNRIKYVHLIAKLQQPELIQNLGRMVIIDLCIGNVDRWNQVRCAPGNMMLTQEQNSQLVLIDHESRLETMDVEQLKLQIFQLLKGDAAQNLFTIMNETFQREGAKIGLAPAEIPQMLKLTMLLVFQEGLHQGANQLIALFPHREALEEFQNRNTIGPDRVDTKLLWQIIEYLKQVKK